MGATLFKCPHCGGRRDFHRTPASWHRKAKVRWVCYGCRIKRRCVVPPDPDGCWPWQGNGRGRYGIIWVIYRGKRYLRNAHRIAYVVWNGPVPKSWAVLHACTESRCCNPGHLYLKQQPLAIDLVELADDNFLD